MYEVTVTAIDDKGALETYRLTFESRGVFDMLLRTDAARSWRVGIEKLEGVRELEEINEKAEPPEISSSEPHEFVADRAVQPFLDDKESQFCMCGKLFGDELHHQDLMEEQIAEQLHRIACHYSHIDQCSWEYEEATSKPWEGQTHKSYLKDATRLIKNTHGTPEGTILTVLKARTD